MHADEIALLRAWQGGNRASGERLFDYYFDDLYRFFRYKVAPADVEDLVQQVLLSTVEGAEQFRGESSLRAFIFGIARNTLFGHYRSNRRTPELDFGVSSLMDLTPTASSLLVRAENDALLLEAMMRLPLDLQLILELHFMMGLSGPELATALEIPEGTVRSRLRRALAATRARVEDMARSPARKVGLSSLQGWEASTL